MCDFATSFEDIVLDLVDKRIWSGGVIKPNYGRLLLINSRAELEKAESRDKKQAVLHIG